MTHNTLVTAQQNTLEVITLPEFTVVNGKYVRKPYIFTMENKDEYCQWVKIWKEQYKALSIESRKEKHLRNEAFRNKKSASSHQSAVLRMREQARTLLEIRKEGKLFIKAMKTAVLM